LQREIKDLIQAGEYEKAIKKIKSAKEWSYKTNELDEIMKKIEERYKQIKEINNNLIDSIK
jgi:hypothetical protein